VRFKNATFTRQSHQIRETHISTIRKSLYDKFSESARSAGPVFSQIVEQGKLLFVFGLGIFISKQSLNVALAGLQFPKTLVHSVPLPCDATQALPKVRSDVAHSGPQSIRLSVSLGMCSYVSQLDRNVNPDVHCAERVHRPITPPLASASHMA
jgi:hypothetical protein